MEFEQELVGLEPGTTEDGAEVFVCVFRAALSGEQLAKLKFHSVVRVE